MWKCHQPHTSVHRQAWTGELRTGFWLGATAGGHTGLDASKGGDVGWDAHFLNMWGGAHCAGQAKSSLLYKPALLLLVLKISGSQEQLPAEWPTDVHVPRLVCQAAFLRSLRSLFCGARGGSSAEPRFHPGDARHRLTSLGAGEAARKHRIAKPND